MVQVMLCDRCHKEIARKKSDNDLDELFERDFNISISTRTVNLKRVKVYTLCDSCTKLYNTIIEGTNKQLTQFMREGKKLAQ